MLKKYKILVNPFVEIFCTNYENFVLSITSLKLKKLFIGLEKNDQEIFFYFIAEKFYVNEILKIFESHFHNFEFKECVIDPIDCGKKYFKLKNFFGLPIRRYDQFEDKFSKNFVDPIELLLSDSMSISNFNLELQIASVDPGVRKNLHKLMPVILFIKFNFLLNILVRFFILGWGRFLLIFVPAQVDSFSTKVHTTEYANDSIVDKINKNLSWVTVGVYCSKYDVSFFESYFNQFNLPYANGFKAVNKKSRCLLSSEELASIFHFPVQSAKFSKLTKVKYLKLIPTFKTECVSNNGVSFKLHNGTEFFLSKESRSRHHLVLGKTGMGKSTLLKQMILQDIHNNEGVCVVDPHGDLITDILKFYPKSRSSDLVYLDPANLNFPVSFNPLDVESYDQKLLVVSGLVEVFKKIFSYSWGPRLEYFLRNSLLLLAESEGETMLSLPRLLTSEKYLLRLLSRVDNKFLVYFFENEFLNQPLKTRQEISAPILNKVGVLMMDPVLRNMFAAKKTKLDFDFCLSQKKVILLNLSKGNVGSLNAHFLGAVFLSLIQVTALKRASISFENRTDFYLYIDEFQNFATDSFAESLSELRKYKLNLILANQFLDQLSLILVNSVLGNVSNYTLFKLGCNDAELFFKQFREKIPMDCFMNLPRGVAYSLFDEEYMNLLTDNSKAWLKNSEVEIGNLLKNSINKYNQPKKTVEFKLNKWLNSI